MKTTRFDRGIAAPAHSVSPRQERLRRARRASVRMLCLAGVLWVTAVVGHLMLADASAEAPPPRASVPALNLALDLHLPAPQ